MLSRNVNALGGAILAAALSLTGAWAGGVALQRAARRHSKELPQTDEWAMTVITSASATVASGKRVFQRQCAHCHGIDAHGDEGPDLHDLQVSDRYIARVVSRGIPHEMPSFAKKLTHDDTAALILFLRSLDDAG
jgi:mono/diheme cytochrome c family protein